jgi:hypothetical protein
VRKLAKKGYGYRLGKLFKIINYFNYRKKTKSVNFNFFWLILSLKLK